MIVRSKVCPRCKGNGSILDPGGASVYMDGPGTNVYERSARITCPQCSGSGSVPLPISDVLTAAIDHRATLKREMDALVQRIAEADAEIKAICREVGK